MLLLLLRWLVRSLALLLLLLLLQLRLVQLAWLSWLPLRWPSLADSGPDLRLRLESLDAWLSRWLFSSVRLQP